MLLDSIWVHDMKSAKEFTQTILLVFVFLGVATSSAFAQTPKELSLRSSAIGPGAVMVKKYTADGDDISPPLAWSAGPATTKSYAISCEDPDAPSGAWWHWIMFNIGPETQQISENVPKSATLSKGVLQGSNDFRKPGYNGPAPPPGKLHHYQFKVMALDTMLSLGPNKGKESFKSAVSGHIVAEGQLTGVYQR